MTDCWWSIFWSDCNSRFRWSWRLESYGIASERRNQVPRLGHQTNTKIRQLVATARKELVCNSYSLWALTLVPYQSLRLGFYAFSSRYSEYAVQMTIKCNNLACCHTNAIDTFHAVQSNIPIWHSRELEVGNEFGFGFPTTLTLHD